MRSTHKFHAIAITVICASITGIFFLLKPAEQLPVDNTLLGDRYIEIYSATWGEACNEYIQAEITARQSKPVEKNEKGEIVQKPLPVLVEKDNVLSKISAFCTGKLTCELTPTSASLEVEPMKSCLKKLDIRYRCFAIDSLKTVSINQAETFKIDCNDNAAAATPSATPQQ
jgi:hypothetical protein